MELRKNIKLILDRTFDFSKLKLFGVQIGDNLEKIPKEIIVENRDLFVRTNQGLVFGKKESQTEIINEFILYEAFLKDLSIDTQEDIIIKFGEPQEIEKSKYGTVDYYYPKRNFVVTWYEADRKLEHSYLISVGAECSQPTSYNAIDFINCYFDFKAMSSSSQKYWNKEDLKDNPSAYYRFLQLNSFLKAFEIGDDLLKDFVSHKFLETKRTKEDFAPIYQELNDFALNYEGGALKEKIKRLGMFDIGRVYHGFMRFLEKTRELLAINNSHIMVSMIGTVYKLQKTGEVLDSIDQSKLNEIYRVLSLIIDPKQQYFTRGELIRNYNFPDVDLGKIDMDYWW